MQPSLSSTPRYSTHPGFVCNISLRININLSSYSNSSRKHNEYKLLLHIWQGKSFVSGALTPSVGQGCNWSSPLNLRGSSGALSDTINYISLSNLPNFLQISVAQRDCPHHQEALLKLPIESFSFPTPSYLSHGCFHRFNWKESSPDCGLTNCISWTVELFPVAFLLSVLFKSF